MKHTRVILSACLQAETKSGVSVDVSRQPIGSSRSGSTDVLARAEAVEAGDVETVALGDNLVPEVPGVFNGVPGAGLNTAAGLIGLVEFESAGDGLNLGVVGLGCNSKSLHGYLC